MTATMTSLTGTVVKQPKSERRQPHWLVPLLVGALLTATVTTSVVENAWHLVTSPFRGSPSAEEQNVTKFFAETKNAGIWESSPVTFDASERYFLRRYGVLDPTRTHTFRPTTHIARLQDVVSSAPVLQGTFLMTLGRVLTSNIVTSEPNVVDTLIQLVPYSVTEPTPKQIDAVVYCRVPLAPGQGYEPGELLFVEGVVAGAGNVAFNDGGFRPAAYMACASVARPAGRCGKGPIPPLPISGQRCQTYRPSSHEESEID